MEMYVDCDWDWRDSSLTLHPQECGFTSLRLQTARQALGLRSCASALALWLPCESFSGVVWLVGVAAGAALGMKVGQPQNPDLHLNRYLADWRVNAHICKLCLVSICPCTDMVITFGGMYIIHTSSLWSKQKLLQEMMYVW